ncbi:MAG TPA: PEPxxWA-CTERM sorting domain-containing protein [Croceibacterium sp.]|nr:PEPxxWA-CTERM sorting domain-containing protein [Croceibacterium sp.]
MSKLKLAAVALVALAISAPASATDFFDDWEDTDFGSGPGFTILQTYSGWNNTTGAPGSGIEIQYNNVAGLAHSGENLVELDSNLNSTMTFGTPLDAGVYTLSFWYSDRPGVGAASNGIGVLLNASSILSVLGGNGGNGTNWILQTVNFTANAGDTLSFTALGTSDSYGGYIDDVRLSGAVPEPATWAMLIFGFGAIGSVLRRSRRHPALATA